MKPVINQVEEQVWNQFRYKVEGQIWYVQDQVWIQVGRKVENKARSKS